MTEKSKANSMIQTPVKMPCEMGTTQYFNYSHHIDQLTVLTGSSLLIIMADTILKCIHIHQYTSNE